MKGVIVLVGILIFSFGINGCYTTLYNYAEGNINFYEPTYPPPPPPPPFPPDPYPCPDPNPQPIIRQPEVPNDRGGSGDQVRDPLRNHGGRSHGERTSDIVNRDGNNSGSLR